MEKLVKDEPIQEELVVDERHQMVLHTSLVDFFALYQVINMRLMTLLELYKFENFDDMFKYYREYVLPKMNEDEDKSRICF